MAVAAGIIAAPTLTFGANGTLVFNHTDTDYVFSLDMSSRGDGATHFIDHIAGNTTLTGDNSLFAGTTTVSGGTLNVEGTLGGTAFVNNGGKLIVGDASHAAASLTGDVLVNAGGTLGGQGTVGTTTIAAGGTVTPGNSIGTLSVDGDVTFEAGSTYLAEINPALDSDLIDASGEANIEGGTVYAQKVAGVYTPDSRWAILGADNGVKGRFDGLDQNMPFVDLELAYDANHVYIDATRNDVAFCDIADTINQCATGNGLETTSGSNPVYDLVAALPDEDSARAALDQLSGEIHASGKTALIEDSHVIRDAVNDHIRASFAALDQEETPAMAYAGTGSNAAGSAIGGALTSGEAERFAAWGTAFGAWGHSDGDGNAAALDHTTGGFVAGLDGLVTETVQLGVVAGYSRSSFRADDRASSGDGDTYHLGVYGGTEIGALGIRGGAAYGWSHIETTRSAAFPGFTDDLGAGYDAGLFQAFGEVSYRIDTPSAAFEPFANLAHVRLATDGFTETGGAAALTGSAGTTSATFATLGIRASTTFDLGDIAATAHGMVGWRHAIGDTVPSDTHALSGGDAFTVTGTPIAKNAAIIEAGLDFAIAPNATLGFSYNGQFASDAHNNGARARLSVKF